jgi:hypothetical protein
LATELSDASQAKKENEKEEVKIKRILVPIDGSNCSVRAAKYAIELATLQKAQIFCIHVIASLPYGYGVAGCAIDEYFEDLRTAIVFTFYCKNFALSPKTSIS